jgi:hypothetical protein
LGVGDVQDILGVEGDGGRPGEIHFEGRSVPVETMLPGSDDGGDDARLAVDAADPVAAGIANIEMVPGIEGDVERQIEPRFATGAAVAAVAGLADAGKVMERTGLQVHAPHPV